MTKRWIDCFKCPPLWTEWEWLKVFSCTCAMESETRKPWIAMQRSVIFHCVCFLRLFLPDLSFPIISPFPLFKSFPIFFHEHATSIIISVIGYCIEKVYFWWKLLCYLPLSFSTAKQERLLSIEKGLEQ